MRRMKKRTIKQQGFVSIIVAAVLMILISLTTIGLTKLMQREQRQALDRQLSTQAFYAAETAVNDVRSRIQLNTMPAGDEKVGCDVATDWNGGVIDINVPEVSYTCLEYDRSPLDLIFTDTIVAESSKVFQIETDPNIGTIRFEWTGEGGSNTIDGVPHTCPSTALPASFAGGTVPMLRLDLIETPNVGSPINRDDLINKTASLYLYPKDCGTNNIDFVSYIGDSSGRVVEVDCTTGSGCVLTINMLPILPNPPIPTSNRYFARVKSIYGTVGTLRVTAQDVLSNQLELKNAQVLVDATGKANDVLRRIEVRLSNSPDYGWAEGSIETSNGLCKLLEITPPETVSNSNCYN